MQAPPTTASNSGNGLQAYKDASSHSGSGSGGQNGQDEHRRRNHTNRGQRQGSGGGNKFKGKCEDLENAIYNVGPLHTSQDLYNTPTKEIAEYAARTCNKAGKFRLGLVDLQLPKLMPPKPPDKDALLAEIEVYKIDLKEFCDKSRKRDVNASKIYTLILGQCSRAIRDKIEASDAWASVNQLSDVMGLLKLIRQLMYTKSTNQHSTVALIEAEIAMHRFKQTKMMSNSVYLEKLKSLVEVYKHLGGEPGDGWQRMKDWVYDNTEDLTKSEDRATVKARARDEYLAVTLILKSDPKRYGLLVDDLIKQHTRRVESFLVTLTKAYEMLVNYRGAHLRHCTHRGYEEGMAYTTVDEVGHSRQSTSGRGG